MPLPLKREHLDKMAIAGCQSCDKPGHKHNEVYLHGVCHVGGEIEAFYRDGIIHINCKVCKKAIVEIQVAL